MSTPITVERGRERAIAAQAIMRVKLRPDRFRRSTAWLRHPYQERPAGDWAIWVLEGGRGSGKTRTGAEEVLHHIEVEHGGPGCFTAGVLMAGRFVGGLKARYRGKIIEIVTANGRRLSITPNHPVLTPEGFIAAGALRKGNRVIGERVGVPIGACVDDYHRPTEVEQVFDALAKSPAFTHGTRETASRHLHGDALHVQGDIEVVTPHRFLGRRIDAAHPESLYEIDLESSHVKAEALARHGGADTLVLSRDTPSARFPRGGEERLRLGGLPAIAQRFGVIAHVDTALSEVAGERPAVDVEFLRELEDRFPGFVAPDEIVDMWEHEFSGHVYDLESTGGWQSANGIITSNCHVGVGAPTNGDVRDICFEEESGIMGEKVGARDRFVKYNRQALEAVHQNGATINGYGSEEPARWNGRNFCFVWHDEGSLENPESITQSQFALRKKYVTDGIEQQPRMIITTTPKPFKHIRELKKEPTTVVTRGTTYQNEANLSRAAIAELRRKYEGTTLGRRELMGEDIDDVEGAMWLRAQIDACRVRQAPHLTRVVVSIDPAVSTTQTSDDTGIAVAGQGEDGDVYVLHIGGYQLSPNGWAKRAIDLYDQHEADRILAERNNGGDMVEATIRTAARSLGRTVPVKTIVASRGKSVRAEPVAALYEQGRVHHVGMFVDAEDQMCSFPVANEHDDMVDALVYAVSEFIQPMREWRAA